MNRQPMASVREIGLAVLTVTVLAGCTQPPVPEDTFFRLTLDAPARQFEAPPLHGTVEVQRFSADGLIGERALVYDSDAGRQRLHQRHYHFWTDSPTRMLQELLVEYLREANLAPQVVTPEHRARSDYVVDGKIKRFEYVTASPGRATVVLELSLRRLSDDELLILSTYQAEAGSGDDSAVGSVRALEQAVSGAYTRFLEDLSARAP